MKHKMEKKTGQRESEGDSQTSSGELNEEPDSVIGSKTTRSILSAYCGGPGPQGARQFVRPRGVPGPR